MSVDRVRQHGLQRPFHPLQVVSWVVFALDVSIFCAVVLPLISAVHWQVLVGLVYAASVSSIVAAALVATLCDSGDPQLRSPPPLEEDEHKFAFCTLCVLHVQPRSKHCRMCNKCVAEFDHHCIWLNNCIGSANYRAFAGAIISAAVMTGLVTGTSLYLAVEFFFDNDAFVSRCDEASAAAADVAGVFTCVLIFMNFPLFLLDSQLIMLHMFLYTQKLTTYEYIVRKHHMEKEVEAGDAPTHSVRTLPRCMDWIVFRRGKKGTRGKKKNDVEKLESPSQAGETTAAPGFETEEAGCKSEWDAVTPPPPGCTEPAPDDSSVTVDTLSGDHAVTARGPDGERDASPQRTPVVAL